MIDWIEPWGPVDKYASNIEAELKSELPPKHILCNRVAMAVGRRVDCDDVLFQLDDGSFAVVHLTCSGKQDQDPKYPWTVIYDSIEEFIEKAMLPDAKGL